MQNTTSSGPRRRPIVGVLVGIILLTIPCYLIGFAALFILQQNNPISPAATATLAPTATQLLPPTPTLGALLPTEFAPPTATMPQLPTPTTAALPTATFTPVPVLPTETPVPLPSPTLTEVPTLVATDAPTPIP